MTVETELSPDCLSGADQDLATAHPTASCHCVHRTDSSVAQAVDHLSAEGAVEHLRHSSVV